MLWQTVQKHIAPGGSILIMDLFRPGSTEAARCLVAKHAADEPEILQEDFYNSLLAAFRLDEIQAQLKQAGLEFCCEEVSDRHIAPGEELTIFFKKHFSFNVYPWESAWRTIRKSLTKA